MAKGKRRNVEVACCVIYESEGIFTLDGLMIAFSRAVGSNSLREI
jgi:hypothetical protein